MSTLMKRVEKLEGQTVSDFTHALTPAEAMAEIKRQSEPGYIPSTDPSPNSPRGRLLALVKEMEDKQ